MASDRQSQASVSHYADITVDARWTAAKETKPITFVKTEQQMGVIALQTFTVRWMQQLVPLRSSQPLVPLLQRKETSSIFILHFTTLYFHNSTVDADFSKF